jgi:hypothetical protein
LEEAITSYPELEAWKLVGDYGFLILKRNYNDRPEN